METQRSLKNKWHGDQMYGGIPDGAQEQKRDTRLELKEIWIKYGL